MIQPELWVASIIVLAMVIYVLTGGADFGAGVWALGTMSSRKKAQREIILKALAPVWEANHVWLVVVVVLLFVGFPKVFSSISIALHVPIILLLIGIVLRGAAFAFLYYGKNSRAAEWRWSFIFALSSFLAPFAMGTIVGSVFSGNIRVEPSTGEVLTDFVSPWFSFYPLSVGFLALFLFSFLGATYLIFETNDPQLKREFRLRAILSGLLLGWMTLVCFSLSQGGTLTKQVMMPKLWPVFYFSISSFAAIGAIMSLILKRDKIGRILAWLQTVLIIVGWAMSQHPHMIVPDLTLGNSAAPASFLIPLLVVLGLGLAVIIPVFVYFYWVFKGPQLSVRKAPDLIGPGQ